MKRHKYIISLVMAFSGVGFSAYHEEPVIEFAPPRVTDSVPARSNMRRELVEAGLRSGAGAALDLAGQRVQKRTGQITTLINKAGAEIRKVLGLPQKPEPLVEGKFLKEGLTPEELDLLAHESGHQNFALHTDSSSTGRSIEILEKLVVKLKQRINNVLTDPTNYKDSAHIQILIKEVNGLLDALEKALEQKEDLFAQANPDVTEIDPDYVENGQYIDGMRKGIGALQRLQSIQADFPSLNRSWFSRLFGKSAMLEPISNQTSNPHSLPFYLFIDSRNQEKTVAPGQLQLEQAIRKQAFELCKNFFLKVYSVKGKPTPQLLQFFKDYRAYQDNPSPEALAKAKVDIKAIVDPAPFSQLPVSSEPNLTQSKPLLNEKEMQTAYKEMSQVLGDRGKTKSDIGVAVARLTRKFPGDIKQKISNALDTPGSLSLDTTVALGKGPGTLVGALGNVYDAIADKKGDTAQAVASLASVAQASVEELRTLFAKQGIESAMDPVLAEYKQALEAAFSQYDVSHDADACRMAVDQARFELELAYKAQLEDPQVEFILWKNKLQQLIDAQVQQLKPIEVVPAKVASEAPVQEPVVLHPLIVEKQQELAAAKQQKALEEQAKKEEIETKLAPLHLKENAAVLMKGVKQLDDLLQTSPFDPQAVIDLYRALDVQIDNFSLGASKQAYEQIKEQYSNNDTSANAVFSPYDSLFTTTSLALNAYSGAIRDLEGAQQLFQDVASAVRTKIPLSDYDFTQLQRFSKSSNPKAAELSQYLQRKASDLLKEITEKRLEPVVPKKLPPLPAVRTVLTDAEIAQKKDQLEDINDTLQEYSEDFAHRIKLINALFAKESLQESDVKQLWQEYNDLQAALQQCSLLGIKLQTISVSGVNQLVEGLGTKQGEVGDALRSLSAQYLQKINELRTLGIERLPDVLTIFSEAKKALQPTVAKAPSLKERLLGSSKQKFSPELTSQLCDLLFWDSSAARVLQQGVRATAMEYLTEGLPQEQSDAMKGFYSRLLSYKVAVSESPASHSLVQQLESFKAEIKKSDVPQRFKDRMSLRIIDELNKLDASLFPESYIQEEIDAIYAQLKEVIQGKMTVENFRLANSILVKSLLKKPAGTDATIKQLSQLKIFMEGNAQSSSDANAFFNAIVSLEEVREAINLSSSRMGKITKTVLQKTITDSERRAELDFKVSTLGPILRLLFFDRAGYGWAHDAIQNEALSILQKAVSEEGLLPENDKTVLMKALSDYQSFQREHTTLQALVGQSEISISQQAALGALRDSVQTALKSIPIAYPGERYAESENQKNPNGPQIVPVPDYIERDFKMQLLARLRADEKQIVELEANIAAGKIKVVSDPQSADSLGGDGDEHVNDTKSDTVSFYSANPGVDEREKDFESGLPPALQDQVDRAMKSISSLKKLAAQFSVHGQAIDGIGLAEHGLSIVKEFEASLSPEVLQQGELVAHMEALKLLFNEAMHTQKLSVIASLQALRAAVKKEFGESVYPPVTKTFKQQVMQLLTPQAQNALEDGSGFKKFVEELLAQLDVSHKNTQSFFEKVAQEQLILQEQEGTVVKAFFEALSPEQLPLQEHESTYVSALEYLKTQDQQVADALQSSSKSEAVAALPVVISELEDSYRFAIFKTLTTEQQSAFEKHNPELYHQLHMKAQGEALQEQVVAIKKQIEKYLVEVYKIDFAHIKTADQVHELLQGTDTSFGGVEKQLATYEACMRMLQASGDVDLAFQLYEEMAPLYKKLKGVEDIFKNLKKDKITDTITFMDRVKFYATQPIGYDSAVMSSEMEELHVFLKNPVEYLKEQEERAQVSLSGAQKVVDPDELLADLQQFQGEIERTLTAKKKASLINQLEMLERFYKPLKDAYAQHEAAIDCAIELGASGGKSLAFEVQLKPADKVWKKLSREAQQKILQQEREQTLAFIAKALSVPGGVFVPPSSLFSVSREILEARLIAKGKTSGDFVGAVDKRYRDLAIVLRNDMLWNMEVAKLQGESVSLPEETKKAIAEWLVSAQAAFDPSLASKMISLGDALKEIKSTLASSTVVG